MHVAALLASVVSFKATSSTWRIQSNHSLGLFFLECIKLRDLKMNTLLIGECYAVIIMILIKSIEKLLAGSLEKDNYIGVLILFAWKNILYIEVVLD